MNIVLSSFARHRLFGGDGRAPRIVGVSPEEFVAHCNGTAAEQVLDGYAPFCKLLVYRNWTATRLENLAIDEENRAALRSGYEARKDGELPVLVRWFEGIETPVAKYLLVIVYSAEQMRREGEPIEADFAVVGCLTNDVPEEIPMAPITMMRNALGVDEGGSGVPLDRRAYERSVDYWTRYANVREEESDV